MFLVVVVSFRINLSFITSIFLNLLQQESFTLGEKVATEDWATETQRIRLGQN